MKIKEISRIEYVFGREEEVKCTHKSGQKTRFRVFSKKERVQMMKFNQKQIKKLAENTNVLQVLEVCRMW